MKLKRLQVKWRTYWRHYRKEQCYKKITSEQRDMFYLVSRVVSANNDKILFDPVSKETLIVLPEALYIIKNNEISILNHNRFVTTWFYDDLYEHVLEIINREAHRYRRKLKYQSTKNIREFINSQLPKEETK